MTSEPELLAELVKANETLAEIKGYARFSNQVLKIFIVLGVIYLITRVALVYIALS
jgi:hypothetical protein